LRICLKNKDQLLLIFLLIFLLGVIVSLTSCGGGEGLPSGFDGKIWAGDSSDATIKRSQTGEVISTSDSKFDDYAAISYSDLSCLYQVLVYNCLSWKQEHVECKSLSTDTIKRTIRKYDK